MINVTLEIIKLRLRLRRTWHWLSGLGALLSFSGVTAFILGMPIVSFPLSAFGFALWSLAEWRLVVLRRNRK